MKAIIIEDEILSQETLTNMLQNFCVDVEIVATAQTVKAAVREINTHNPDLIFLDIELPEQNGFELFQYFESPDFEVIFTTAYNKYALNALKLSAVDYLLKPINLNELRNALELVKKNIRNKTALNNLNILKENLGSKLKKVALPTSTGYTFVEMEQIIRCEANGNYTFFYLNNGEKILVSKTLKLYSDLLEDFNFFRINRGNLINLQYLSSYGRQKMATVTLNDGTVLSLSQGKKEDFLKLLENF